MTSSRSALAYNRVQIAFGVAFLYLFILVWSGFIASSLTLVKHTWTEPAATPGALRTERWGRDYFFLLSIMVLVWFIPITLLYMIAYPMVTGVRRFHIIFTLLILIYFVVIAIIWGTDYNKINLALSSNARNMFNDDRWCLLHWVLAPNECGNTAGPPAMGNPSSGITDAMLGVNGVTATTFWMLVVYLFFMAIDIIFVWVYFQGNINAFIETELEREGKSTLSTEREREREEPLIPAVEKKHEQPFYFDSPKTGLILPSRYKTARQK